MSVNSLKVNNQFFVKAITCKLLFFCHTVLNMFIRIPLLILLFQQTYIGTVVVSVNPYKNLPIYSQDVIEKYRGENLYELPPHM